MVAALTIRVDSKDVRLAMKKLPREFGAQARQRLREHGAWLERYVVRTRFSGYPGPDAEVRANPLRKRLYSRTGALRRSIRSQMLGSGLKSVLRFSIGSGLTRRYVWLQEVGGRIVGRPFLTIPLPPNITPGGRTRFPSARALRAQGRTFLLRTKGNPVIALKERIGGRRGRIQAIFVLVRSVFVPGRLRFRVAALEAAPVGDRKRRLNNAARQSIARAFGRSAIGRPA